MIGAAVVAAAVGATQANPATMAAPAAAYSDGTRMVPVQELPRAHQQQPDKRLWEFDGVLLVQLAVLAGLLFLLSKTLGLGEDDDGGETVAEVEVPRVVDQLFTDAQ